MDEPTSKLMEEAYADEVELPPDTQMEGGLPVVEDWQDDEDEDPDERL